MADRCEEEKGKRWFLFVVPKAPVNGLINGF